MGHSPENGSTWLLSLQRSAARRTELNNRKAEAEDGFTVKIPQRTAWPETGKNVGGKPADKDTE